LTEDHARVKRLFKDYEKLAKEEATDDDKEELATLICAELTAHATAEEEVLYPAARAAIDEPDLVDEAAVEHATAKDLIAQIMESTPDEDELFDAKVKVLGEYIDHHVKEEEGELFPKLKKAKVDTAELGERIAARKSEILAELGFETTAA
jgi:hemerythrin superfamily protein